MDIKQKNGRGEGSDSLRSKLFRVVSEQRKSKERDFPRSFTRPIFRSLTLVPCSLTRNRAKTLATQAKDPREGQKLSQTNHYD